MRERLDPSADHAPPAITAGRASLRSISPFRKSLAAATAVPKVDESLLVARLACIGMPVSMKAGSEMSPPPPAIESTSPERKRSGQTMRNDTSVGSKRESMGRSSGIAVNGALFYLLFWMFQFLSGIQAAPLPRSMHNKEQRSV